MSVRISLILEVSEMFLSLHMIFILERVDVWAIPERISGFDPSLEMILQGTWSSPLLLASDLLSWSLFGSHLGCLSSLLSSSGPMSILYLVVVVSRRSTRTPASSSSSAFTIMSSAKWKLVISRLVGTILVWSGSECEWRSREAVIGGSGVCSSRNFLKWCNLGLFLNDVCGRIFPLHSDILLRVSLIT